jgi:hypothetical protein
MPVAIPIAIVAAGALGAASTAITGSNAADKQAEAAQNAANIQQQEFNTAEQLSTPERNLGAGASSLLSQIYGINPQTGAVNPGPNNFNWSSFYQTPGFQFALNTGKQAINSGAAASGNMYTPNTQANLGGYASGLASNTYQNYVNSLIQQAGIGANAATQTGNQAVQTGQGVSNSLTNVGQAQAAGTNALGGAITGLTGLIQNNTGVQNAIGNYFNPPNTSTSSGYSVPNAPYLQAPFLNTSYNPPSFNQAFPGNSATALQALGSQ